MTNSHLAWSKTILIVFLFGSALLLAFNYLVDPFEVFQTNPFHLRTGYSVNERFMKVEHLLHNPQKYPGLILGSSLTGALDPAIAKKATGMPFYNLCFLDGRPHEYIETVKALKAAGYPIKEVLIGIDFYVFSEPPNDNSPAHREHPIVTGESYAAFYASYLFTNGLYQGFLKVRESMMKVPDFYFDIGRDGRFYLFGFDDQIKEDHQTFIRKNLSAKQSPSDITWHDDRFNEFAAFNDWLRANGIRSKVFIHPFFINFRNSVSKKSFDEFRKRIMQIRPDTVDFSDSSITRDPNFYYDPHHYRPIVADKIMQIMFNSKPVAKELNNLSKSI